MFTSGEITIFAIILLISLLSLVLFIFGISAFKTTRDKRLLFVAAAFFIFFLKNLIVFLSLFFGWIGHEDLEFVDSLFDLITIILLVIPVFKKDI
ncbi:MAG: hypothetical protein ACFFD1_07775 [Candidatus Thorarchaeota archaeon]